MAFSDETVFSLDPDLNMPSPEEESEKRLGMSSFEAPALKLDRGPREDDEYSVSFFGAL
jgi:hypothetical protein